MIGLRLARVAAATSLCLITACPQKADIWIAPGSSAQHLVFRLGEKRGHPGGVVTSGLIVVSCSKTVGPIPDSVTAWSTWRREFGEVSTIVYGEAPQGWSTRHGPLALGPGCYVAEASAVGAVRFVVDAAGAVTDRGQAY